MPTQKTLYETQDGKLFSSEQEALIHEQEVETKIQQSLEDAIKLEEEKYEDKRKIDALFEEKQALLIKAANAVREYLKKNAEYKKYERDFLYKYKESVYDMETTFDAENRAYAEEMALEDLKLIVKCY